jgi:hypothetical protein
MDEETGSNDDIIISSGERQEKVQKASGRRVLPSIPVLCDPCSMHVQYCGCTSSGIVYGMKKIVDADSGIKKCRNHL